MAVQRGWGFEVRFDEVFGQVGAAGVRSVDSAGNSKPSGAGRSGNAPAQGEQKVA